MIRSVRAGVVFTFLFVLMTAATPVPAQTAAKSVASAPESLTAAEFSRISRELSEDGGYFRSDNFTSNETSYLHVVDKIREIGATGGAYIGVGPEQNFTYIAKIRPRLAILMDIRRQAIIQHLMYKAIFHHSPDRVQFLSRLFSRPLPKDGVPKRDAPIGEILTFIDKLPGEDKTYAANLAEIRRTIEEDFKFPLSEADRTSLDYVYSSFRTDALDIAYRVDGSRGGYFPTLGEIIMQPDQHGKLGNFLAIVEDYEFVRGMHGKNLIIPVVGDFGGKKALAAIGDFLRSKGLTVTAYYTSNVEQYLFGSDLFEAFAENVRKLPINERSLFIRAVAGRFPHPAQWPGHRLTTLLQRIPIFLRDFDEGRYATYRDLVTTNYISP
ncbi:MAG: hypothetical protein KF868_22430 [Acidobacteria bacterium]|nr:hypothetical protein [Acidobacteriota bacterium]MCW5970333.1 hypothetical protein [Blastocatellales bacterium]